MTTDGHLLGGRVLYRQPSAGFRSGIEPVFLAASVPARAGEHVLEAGTGAGAALLCLSVRVPGVVATGVECDAATAELARVNAQANGLPAMAVMADRIEDVALVGRFDHAIANPPYHQPDGSTSPSAARVIAKRGSEALIRAWIGCLSLALRHRGTLTLIIPSAMLAVSLSAMIESRCPCNTIFPLWPKPGRPAKLMLLRAAKGSRAPVRLMSGMVLHLADGSYTDAARSVLNDAAGLPLHD